MLMISGMVYIEHSMTASY